MVSGLKFQNDFFLQFFFQKRHMDSMSGLKIYAVQKLTKLGVNVKDRKYRTQQLINFYYQVIWVNML